ncbi:MAG: hypothetical protein WCB27_23505 [Thermoguttaceae bacterium]
MANLPWLDEVLARLARRGLPPNYVRRFAEELSDHLDDLKEENMSKAVDVVSRLGKPEQVAEAAVTAYRRRSFLGRHPTAAFLVFAVSPLVSQIGFFVITAVGVRILALLADRLGILSDNGKYAPPGPVALEAMQYVFSFLFTVIPSILAAILYCKLGRRFGVARQWVLVSCLVLALMAMQPWWCVRIGADAAGHIRVVSALMIPFLSRGWSICCQLHVSQLIQLAVPLAIGWWFLRRVRSRGRPQLAS